MNKNSVARQAVTHRFGITDLRAVVTRRKLRLTVRQGNTVKGQRTLGPAGSPGWAAALPT